MKGPSPVTQPEYPALALWTEEVGAHRPGAPVARDKHLSAAPARLPVEGSRGRHQALVVEAPLRPPSCERCLALPGSEATSDISGTDSQMSTETRTEVQGTTGMDSGPLRTSAAQGGGVGGGTKPSPVKRTFVGQRWTLTATVGEVVSVKEDRQILVSLAVEGARSRRR